MAGGVRILGREKLLRQMHRMPNEVRSAIKQSLAQVADEITDYQRRLVPVASGKLKESIVSIFGDKPAAPNSGVIGGGGTILGDPDLTLWILAGSEEAYYARWVEFGTVAQRGQPFFFPPYRAFRRRGRRMVGNAMRKAMRRVAAS
jgi:HK97 gp10 family phage protein